MSEVTRPPHIDVRTWCQSARQLDGHDVLLNFERLMEETKGLGGENTVEWAIRAESPSDPAGQFQARLQLKASLTLPLTCQRCLGAVDVPVDIRRSFRFVATEAQAELEDDESDEDVLVMSRDFDVSALIEDEVLMDLPVVPRHEVCPVAVKLVAVDAGFDAAAVKPNPFAALAGLKAKPGDS